MSHFACSEEDHPLNAIQIERFAAVRASFPGHRRDRSRIPPAFSSARTAHHDLVRPGVALYGANPTPGKPNPMRAVVTLQGRIVQTRDVAPGATVGYSATWTARRPTRLAIVSVGYADGFLRAASASDAAAGRRGDRRGAALSPRRPRLDGPDRGRRDRRAGRPPKRGDLVTLLGDGIGVDDLADRAGTIGYEVLTSLGPALPADLPPMPDSPAISNRVCSCIVLINPLWFAALSAA